MESTQQQSEETQKQHPPDIIEHPTLIEDDEEVKETGGTMHPEGSSRQITSDMVRYYQWDESMTEKAKELIKQSEELKQAQVTDIMYQKYEKDAKRNWDLFYKTNKTNFYKDRHYIKYEFVELSDTITKCSSTDQQFVLLDAGCGVGNGFYPLYREYPGRLRVHACDFSPRAVEFAKQNELYDAERIKAQTCDLVQDEQLPFPKETANFGLFLFVLSAISPENFPKVAKKIFEQMAEGGIFYFRDYGRYDLAQLRLAQRSNQKLKDNFYVRSDKTRAYYFTTDEVKEIFEGAGFTQVENQYHYRLIENRKDQKTMHRVWIQAKFMKKAPASNQIQDVVA